MPFSFNLRTFGRYNEQPAVEKPFIPTGLAPPYNQQGAPPPSAPDGSPYNRQLYDGPSDTGLFPPMHPPVVPPPAPMPPQNIRDVTRGRLNMSAMSACFLFITVIFLIMVQIGNTHNKAVLRDIWFIKMHFVDIDPAFNNTPGLGFGIKEALGLYDFYQVGLWNYAEGWNSTGIAYTSPPKALFWWNPIDMFGDQINGFNSSTSVPQNMYHSLDDLKDCSVWMFGLFMAGSCLSFVLIPTVLLGMKSKWYSAGLAVITFLNMVCVVAATIIATAIFVIIRDLLKDYEEVVNLVPKLGSTMFAMMWIAAIFSIFAFLTQVTLSCFYPSERDFKRRQLAAKTQSFMW